MWACFFSGTGGVGGNFEAMRVDALIMLMGMYQKEWRI